MKKSLLYYCLVFLAGCATPEEVFMPKPFLVLPLAAGTKFSLGEGWLYSEYEQSVHGFITHYGVDLDCERGTPVYAMADGLAISSAQFYYLDRKYQGKQVGFGLGNFVQIWHPETGLFTQYAHLENIGEDIPFFPPVSEGKHLQPPAEIYRHAFPEVRDRAREVKRGQLIGWAGDSGCSWGYKEQPLQVRDHRQLRSWDQPHLHIEVFGRGPSGKKDPRFDPFSVYGQADKYRGETGTIKQGEGGLFLTDESGLMLFAR